MNQSVLGQSSPDPCGGLTDNYCLVKQKKRRDALKNKPAGSSKANSLHKIARTDISVKGWLLFGENSTALQNLWVLSEPTRLFLLCCLLKMVNPDNVSSVWKDHFSAGILKGQRVRWCLGFIARRWVASNTRGSLRSLTRSRLMQSGSEVALT